MLYLEHYFLKNGKTAVNKEKTMLNEATKKKVIKTISNAIKVTALTAGTVGMTMGCIEHKGDDLPIFTQNITIKGHTVLVQSDTGIVPDNVMSKLNAALSTSTFQNLTDSIFSTAHTKGLIIIIENSGALYTGRKVSGNQVKFHINYINNDEITPTMIAANLVNGINNVANGENYSLAPAYKTPQLNRQAVAFGNEKARTIGRRV
jgi:hypothetical protein